MRRRNRELKEKIKEAELLAKQEQIKREKDKALVIRALNEDNKGILNKVAVQELKNDGLGQPSDNGMDDSNNSRGKSKPRYPNRAELDGINSSIVGRQEPEIIQQLIVHRRKIAAMVNQTEQLTETLEDEEDDGEALQGQLKRMLGVKGKEVPQSMIDKLAKAKHRLLEDLRDALSGYERVIAENIPKKYTEDPDIFQKDSSLVKGGFDRRRTNRKTLMEMYGQSQPRRTRHSNIANLNFVESRLFEAKEDPAGKQHKSHRKIHSLNKGHQEEDSGDFNQILEGYGIKRPFKQRSSVNERTDVNGLIDMYKLHREEQTPQSYLLSPTESRAPTGFKSTKSESRPKPFQKNDWVGHNQGIDSRGGPEDRLKTPRLGMHDDTSESDNEKKGDLFLNTSELPRSIDSLSQFRQSRPFGRDEESIHTNLFACNIKNGFETFSPKISLRLGANIEESIVMVDEKAHGVDAKLNIKLIGVDDRCKDVVKNGRKLQSGPLLPTPQVANRVKATKIKPDVKGQGYPLIRTSNTSHVRNTSNRTGREGNVLYASNYTSPKGGIQHQGERLIKEKAQNKNIITTDEDKIQRTPRISKPKVDSKPKSGSDKNGDDSKLAGLRKQKSLINSQITPVKGDHYKSNKHTIRQPVIERNELIKPVGAGKQKGEPSEAKTQNTRVIENNSGLKRNDKPDSDIGLNTTKKRGTQGVTGRGMQADLKGVRQTPKQYEITSLHNRKTQPSKDEDQRTALLQSGQKVGKSSHEKLSNRSNKKINSFLDHKRRTVKNSLKDL